MIQRHNKAVDGFAYSKLIVNLPCLSHILSNCGKKMDIDVLNNFMKLWNSLFAHSFKAKTAWSAKAGSGNPASSNTRWWTFWRQVSYINKHWCHVRPFLVQFDGSEETVAPLMEMMNDQDTVFELRVEMDFVPILLPSLIS